MLSLRVAKSVIAGPEALAAAKNQGQQSMEKRRTAKAPVGARAARSGNKWSPGLKHGPTRLTSIAATPLGLAGRERLGSKEPAVSWMAVSRIAVLQIV